MKDDPSSYLNEKAIIKLIFEILKNFFQQENLETKTGAKLDVKKKMFWAKYHEATFFPVWRKFSSIQTFYLSEQISCSLLDKLSWLPSFPPYKNFRAPTGSSLIKKLFTKDTELKIFYIFGKCGLFSSCIEKTKFLNEDPSFGKIADSKFSGHLAWKKGKFCSRSFPTLNSNKYPRHKKKLLKTLS